MEAVNFPTEFLETAAGSSDFPSNAEFAKDEAAFPWRDVECNVPFKMLQLFEVTTVNGHKEMVVNLQKRDNTVINIKDTGEEYVYHESWKEDNEKVEKLLL